ncbi:MAG: glycoside hydrolase family 130 protein [Spirochaetales bacterium]|nr:glycoside hydrolase family 130 protein [Spirochaetales bacterium]
MKTYKALSESIKNLPWQDPPEQTAGPVWRYSENPVIRRNPVAGVGRIFNSAVLPYKGGFVGVFRAEYVHGRPFLHFGTSSDGISWTIDEDPIYMEDESGKPYQPLYAYDPRLVKIGDCFYIIWCTDFYGASLGMARTTDFKRYVRLENPFLPFNRNGVLFPRKINGNFLLLSRPSDSGHTPFGDIFLSESPDLVYWGKHRHVMSKGGQGWWQNIKIGGGPAPIETDIGWLFLYHGVTGTCNGFVYSMGAAILDGDEPARVLYRSRNYILTPEEPYEENGFVNNVVFPCAALADAETGRIAIYYGAADTCVGLAFSTVDRLISYCIDTREQVGDDQESGRI